MPGAAISPKKPGKELEKERGRGEERGGGRTLMILGMWSLGVSSPKQASTPQKIRMEKTLEKSAMKALTWRQDRETGLEWELMGWKGGLMGWEGGLMGWERN